MSEQGNTFTWDGETFWYSSDFERFDPEFELQSGAEGYIAAHLFDCYQEYDLVGHVQRMINIVIKEFSLGNPTPVQDDPRTITGLYATVYRYLLPREKQWVSHQQEGPSEEEAAQIGRDLLILIVGFLWPHFVIREDVEESGNPE